MGNRYIVLLFQRRKFCKPEIKKRADFTAERGRTEFLLGGGNPTRHDIMSIYLDISAIDPPGGFPDRHFFLILSGS